MTRRLFTFSFGSLWITQGALAQGLVASWSGEELRVSAPNLHFLEGRYLDRLKNGQSVAYDFDLQVFEGAAIQRRGFERFVVSYDLWEEKFQVTRLKSRVGGVVRLATLDAERWCIEGVGALTTGLAPDRPMRVRLEIRAQERKTITTAEDAEGVPLDRLIAALGNLRTDKAPNEGFWKAEMSFSSLASLPKPIRRMP